MKKILKTVIIMLFLTSAILMTSYVYASNSDIYNWNYVPGLDPNQSLGTTVLNFVGTIIKLIRNLIIIGSVIVIIVIGMQTIMNSHDPEKSKEYQKKLINVIVIAVFTSSIVSIVSVIFELMT